MVIACTGFTGADIQNLMNEAAILAARRELKEISKEEIADALERIVAGPEKKGAVVSEPKKRLVAYHEVWFLLKVSCDRIPCVCFLSHRLHDTEQSANKVFAADTPARC